MKRTILPTPQVYKGMDDFKNWFSGYLIKNKSSYSIITHNQKVSVKKNTICKLINRGVRDTKPLWEYDIYIDEDKLIYYFYYDELGILMMNEIVDIIDNKLLIEERSIDRWEMEHRILNLKKSTFIDNLYGSPKISILINKIKEIKK